MAMDEACKQLHAHVQPPMPMTPGKPAREDDKYQRHGTRALFLFFAPLLGWRRVSQSKHRTRSNWAEQNRSPSPRDANAIRPAAGWWKGHSPG